jgi:hypothetical protein
MIALFVLWDRGSFACTPNCSTFPRTSTALPKNLPTVFGHDGLREQGVTATPSHDEHDD